MKTTTEFNTPSPTLNQQGDQKISTTSESDNSNNCCIFGVNSSTPNVIMDLHKDANTIEELDNLLQSRAKVILYISAKWCSPCRSISPVFGALSEDPSYKDILFIKTDSDLNPEHPVVKNTPGIPCFITYYNQKELERFSGPNPLELKTVLDNLAKMKPFVY